MECADNKQAIRTFYISIVAFANLMLIFLINRKLYLPVENSTESFSNSTLYSKCCKHNERQIINIKLNAGTSRSLSKQNRIYILTHQIVFTKYRFNET